MHQHLVSTWLVALSVMGALSGCGEAGAPGDDAGVEPCTSHADCNDDLFCTGEELCMPGHPSALASGCVLGTPPCAATSCNEAQARCETECADVDGDGHPDAACGGDDCDDDDGQRFPGNTEVCDLLAHDEDCDPCTVGTLDADMDLFLSAVCANAVTVAPSPACGIAVVYDTAMGRVRGLDCNDATGMIKPGQAETCNAVDDDCDGDVDENLTLEMYWPDVDMDQAGDESAAPTLACARPEGMAASAGDCDDLKPEVRPLGTELCDALDNDCDSNVDEQSSSYTFYRDQDDDGVGSSLDPTTAVSCDPPTGYSALPGDCDDDDDLIYPGALERCDRVDNNCSLVGSPGGVDASEDPDEDGHSPEGATCDSTAGGAFPADDCDEANVTVHGGATEFCSAVDEDCDGQNDESGADVCGSADSCDQGCLSGQRISVGDADVCSVLSDGGVACWGSPAARVPQRVAGLSNVEQVSAGGAHVCVRLADRTVRCWGDNQSGQLGVGHTAVVAGLGTPLGLGEVVAVEAGYLYSCALKANGEVWCWGAGANGQLGRGDTMSASMPTRVPGLSGVVELQVRDNGVCARTGTQRVFCWGSGPTGDGVSNSSLVPDEATLTGALELAADHWSASVCVRQSGGWSCWGPGASTGTGNATTVLSPTPLAVPGGAEQVTLGNSLGCALDAGEVSCWGTSDTARFGEAVEVTGVVPATAAVTVPLTRAPSFIHCGTRLCCGLAGDEVTCWGSPDDPRHGDGLRTGSSPSAPVGLTNVSAIELGGDASCAVSGGALQCWGAANSGNGSQSGFADGLTRYLPATVAPSGITQVALGSTRACSLDGSGAVRCWGAGPAGDAAQTIGSSVPVVVDQTGMGPATQVQVGGDFSSAFSCALDLTGGAWCWGSGPGYVCGSATCSTTPTLVGGGHTFASLSAGLQHVCGVTTGGELFCWGNGGQGRLGNGTTGSGFGPQHVLAPGGVGFLADVTQVVAGFSSTCALLGSGQVACTGSGSGHELGNGSTANVSTPVLVTGLNNADRLACAVSNCLARTTDGTWVGWGSNLDTDLGIVGTSPVPTPAPAAFGVAFEHIELAERRACGISADGAVQCWGGATMPDWNPLALPLVTVISMP